VLVFNAISSHVKINKRKSVHIREYKLPINVQNFMQKDSVQAKMSSKVVGGYFFDSPCSCVSWTFQLWKFHTFRKICEIFQACHCKFYWMVELPLLFTNCVLWLYLIYEASSLVSIVVYYTGLVYILGLIRAIDLTGNLVNVRWYSVFFPSFQT